MLTRHEKNFTEKQVQMANQHMKHYSVSLAITEMQMRTAMRWHDTPVGMAKIGGDAKCGCGGRQVRSSHMASGTFFKNKVQLPDYPAMMPSSIHPGEMKTYVHTTWTPVFTAVYL